MKHVKNKKYRKEKSSRYYTNLYIPLYVKFYLSHGVALLWLLFSIYLSLRWVDDLAQLITLPLALIIISGIAYIPGYISMFTVSSLLLDRQPKHKVEAPSIPITVIIACHNEETNIGVALQYLYRQNYFGEIKIIVVDNNSTDNTSLIAKTTGEVLGLNLMVIQEPEEGKHNALNTAISYVTSDYFITLDADTLLMPDSVNYLIARQLSSPPDVVATAGAVMVRNSRINFWTKIQEWDYFLGISSVKRLQGMYQGTLVAQGAYSLYKTDVIKEVGGYSNVIGEDIVLTWELLKQGYKVYFEPYAVAFTEVPDSLKHFQRQRSRWSRGMVEALRRVKPWQHKNKFVMYATFMNLLMPFIDAVYTFVFMPSIILAFMGYTWVVGLMTLLLLPLALFHALVLLSYQRKVFKTLNLRIRKNKLGFIFYILGYQLLMAPISLYGFIEEIFNFKRVWK